MVTRRNLLRWGLAGAPTILAGGCCKRTPTAVAGSIPDPAIDVHCHVFNAQDLPVAGFVVESLLKPALLGSVLAAAADLLVTKLSAMLETFAPDAQTELAYLQAPGGWDATAAFDRAALRLLADTTAGSPPGAAAPQSLKAQAQFPSLVSLVMGALQPGAWSYLQNMPEAPPAGLTPDDILGPSEIGRELAHYLGWVRQMCDYRVRNIDRLLQLFGPERQGPGILVPSLVDFHRWLGSKGPLEDAEDRKPGVSVDEQVALMSKIVQQRPNVLPFVPFDPRRSQQESLRLLETCFSEDQPNGFAGVKLYPPMGFAPGSNRHIAAMYPDDPRAGELASMVENNLKMLYTFCEDHDVPIMSHTTDANATALSLSGTTYLPSLWRPVLGEHPNLRLNLAHFGGVEHFVNGSTPGESRAMAELFTTFGHVFADMANETGPASADFRASFGVAFSQYASMCPAFVKRLMYGSDWDILGMTPRFETFLDDWAATVDGLTTAPTDGGATGGFRDGFFFENALAFLGLSEKGNKNAKRLMAFHGSATPDWLNLAVRNAQ